MSSGGRARLLSVTFRSKCVAVAVAGVDREVLTTWATKARNTTTAEEVAAAAGLT